MKPPIKTTAPTHDRLQQSLSLRCPPFPAISASGEPNLPSLMSVRNGAPAEALNVIGLELKVAFMAMSRGGNGKADNDFWLRKCRELCLRPAAEPLLFAHWDKLKSFAMTDEQMASFCSLLCGARQQARTRDSYGLWEGADVAFEPPQVARTWLADIRNVASNPELRALLPAYAYARTIIAHPYPDGNGRLARAMLHGALAREADLSAPILPLAPAFFKNGAKVAEAIRTLSPNGDWNQMALTIAHVIQDALAMARLVRAA